MGLWPTQGMKIADNLRLSPSPVTAAVVSAPLPFVIPSEAEGFAVQRTPLGTVFFDRPKRSGGSGTRSAALRTWPHQTPSGPGWSRVQGIRADDSLQWSLRLELS